MCLRGAYFGGRGGSSGVDAYLLLYYETEAGCDRANEYRCSEIGCGINGVRSMYQAGTGGWDNEEKGASGCTLCSGRTVWEDLYRLPAGKYVSLLW